MPNYYGSFAAGFIKAFLEAQNMQMRRQHYQVIADYYRFRGLMQGYDNQTGKFLNVKTGQYDQPSYLDYLKGKMEWAKSLPNGEDGGGWHDIGGKDVSIDPNAKGKGEYSLGEMVDMAKKAGFKGDDAAHMAALARAESGGNPKAVGDAGEIGLTQINPHAWGDLADEARDPQGAFDAAYRVFNRQGWGAWSTDPRSANFTPGNNGMRFFNSAKNYLDKSPDTETVKRPASEPIAYSGDAGIEPLAPALRRPLQPTIGGQATQSGAQPLPPPGPQPPPESPPPPSRPVTPTPTPPVYAPAVPPPRPVTPRVAAAPAKPVIPPQATAQAPAQPSSSPYLMATQPGQRAVGAGRSPLSIDPYGPAGVTHQPSPDPLWGPNPPNTTSRVNARGTAAQPPQSTTSPQPPPRPVTPPQPSVRPPDTTSARPRIIFPPVPEVMPSDKLVQNNGGDTSNDVIPSMYSRKGGMITRFDDGGSAGDGTGDGTGDGGVGGVSVGPGTGAPAGTGTTGSFGGETGAAGEAAGYGAGSGMGGGVTGFGGEAGFGGDSSMGGGMSVGPAEGPGIGGISGYGVAGVNAPGPSTGTTRGGFDGGGGGGGDGSGGGGATAGGGGGATAGGGGGGTGSFGGTTAADYQHALDVLWAQQHSSQLTNPLTQFDLNKAGQIGTGGVPSITPSQVTQLNQEFAGMHSGVGPSGDSSHRGGFGGGGGGGGYGGVGYGGGSAFGPGTAPPAPAIPSPSTPPPSVVATGGGGPGVGWGGGGGGGGSGQGTSPPGYAISGAGPTAAPTPGVSMANAGTAPGVGMAGIAGGGGGYAGRSGIPMQHGGPVSPAGPGSQLPPLSPEQIIISMGASPGISPHAGAGGTKATGLRRGGVIRFQYGGDTDVVAPPVVTSDKSVQDVSAQVSQGMQDLSTGARMEGEAPRAAMDRRYQRDNWARRLGSQQPASAMPKQGNPSLFNFPGNFGRWVQSNISQATNPTNAPIMNPSQWPITQGFNQFQRMFYQEGGEVTTPVQEAWPTPRNEVTLDLSEYTTSSTGDQDADEADRSMYETSMMTGDRELMGGGYPSGNPSDSLQYQGGSLPIGTPQIADDDGNPSRGVTDGLAYGAKSLIDNHELGGEQGAIPSEGGTRKRDDFLGSDAAIDSKIIDQVGDTVDPGKDLDPAMRNLASIESVYKYGVMIGNKDAAAHTVGSMLLGYRDRAKEYGIEAAKDLQKGDIDKAIANIQLGYNEVPDGKRISVTKGPNGELIARQSDLKNKTLWEQQISPHDLLAAAHGLGTGIGFWRMVGITANTYDPHTREGTQAQPNILSPDNNTQLAGNQPIQMANQGLTTPGVSGPDVSGQSVIPPQYGRGTQVASNISNAPPQPGPPAARADTGRGTDIDYSRATDPELQDKYDEIKGKYFDEQGNPIFGNRVFRHMRAPALTGDPTIDGILQKRFNDNDRQFRELKQENEKNMARDPGLQGIQNEWFKRRQDEIDQREAIKARRTERIKEDRPIKPNAEYTTPDGEKSTVFNEMNKSLWDKGLVSSDIIPNKDDQNTVSKIGSEIYGNTGGKIPMSTAAVYTRALLTQQFDPISRDKDAGTVTLGVHIGKRIHNVTISEDSLKDLDDLRDTWKTNAGAGTATIGGKEYIKGPVATPFPAVTNWLTKHIGPQLDRSLQ